MKLKKTLAIILVTVMLLSASLFSAEAAKKATLPENFEFGIGPETEGYSIDYRYFSPVKENDTTKYPLVIWLHGMSDGLSDGVQITKSDISNWTTDEYQSRFKNSGGAFIFAPRSLEEKGMYWPDELVYPLRAAIDSFTEEHKENIDVTRIYIGGYSMGGLMTLKMAVAYPDMFAAIFPICPAWIPDVDATVHLKDTPVWVTSCASDPVVNYFLYVMPTWKNIVSCSNMPENCRFSTLAVSLKPNAMPTFNGHNAWMSVTFDMFASGNKPYYTMKTQNGLGENVEVTYPDGMISWLSGFTSDYDGAKATDGGNSDVLSSDARVKGFDKVKRFAENFFTYIFYMFDITR